jgi:hypothetical protein
MSLQTTVRCPKCNTEIDVNKILYQQLEKKLEEQTKLEKQKFELKIKEQIKDETSEEMKLLQNELNEKSNQVKELHKTKAEMEKLKRDNSEIEDRIKAESEKKLNERLEETKLKIKKEAEEKSILKLKEKDEQLEQLQRKLEDAKRISEQGSMQIQGEAQELAIEEWLQSQFKYDNIEEIKKGAFGADCTQTVNERDIQNCGVICYESKNTKTWNNEWITKLKQDMLRVKGDIGVLVTQVMPNNMERMGFYNGIWVCTYEEFRGSSSLLRDGLIRVHKKMQTQENKTDKMSLLYNYLTSSEFNMQFNTIVDGFIKMQGELDKEKRSIQSAWKRRQKIIDGVISNTTEIYGSLHGIAGNSIGNIKSLEYDNEDSEDSEEVETKEIIEKLTISKEDLIISQNDKINKEIIIKKEDILEISTTLFKNNFKKINEKEYKDKHTQLIYTLVESDNKNIKLKKL